MAPVPSATVVLVGMMGSGKTSVGTRLSTLTGWPYLDNDELVRLVTGREPEAIDARDGEAALHAAEADALRHALEMAPPLIAGAAAWVVVHPPSVALLTAATTVVYLRASATTLRSRIGSGAGRRKDATDLEWLRARLDERDATYRGVANLTIDTDGHATDAVAAAIMGALAPDEPSGGDLVGE